MPVRWSCRRVLVCSTKLTSMLRGGAVGGDAYCIAIAHREDNSLRPRRGARSRWSLRPGGADQRVRRALQAVSLPQRDRRQIRPRVGVECVAQVRDRLHAGHCSPRSRPISKVCRCGRRPGAHPRPSRLCCASCACWSACRRAWARIRSCIQGTCMTTTPTSLRRAHGSRLPAPTPICLGGHGWDDDRMRRLPGAAAPSAATTN